MRLVKALIGLAIFLCIGYGGARVYKHYNRPKPQPVAPRKEVTITIIPGWNLRQVAEMLVLKGLASSTADVYNVTGEPGKFYVYNCKRDERTYPGALNCPSTFYAQYQPAARWAGKNVGVSLEGVLTPETYRVFADASLSDVVKKFVDQGYASWHDADLSDLISGTTYSDVLTMASIVEDEAKTLEDRKIVADILWRRNAKRWALQVDSSVHYAIDKVGTVFTTGKERDVDSPWNTYKYPGLPPGPICNPSVESIDAALHPTPNNYWYFLSGRDGTMHYAKTLDEHNLNKKYL